MCLNVLYIIITCVSCHICIFVASYLVRVLVIQLVDGSLVPLKLKVVSFELLLIITNTNMKRIIIVALLGIFFVSTSSFALVKPPVNNRSTKTSVGEVQAVLNTCNNAQLNVDGLFGPNTLRAVRNFQRVEGLSVDGIIGSRTAAALNDCWDAHQVDTPVVPPVVQTTVPLCPNGLTLASNCTLLPNSTGTVVLCPNGMTLASNCLSNSTAPVPTSGENGILSNIQKLSSYNNTRLTEGEHDIRVYGVEVFARDADQSIDGLMVSFKNTGSGSTRFTRYASDVSLWLDGVEIGRKDASEYSTDSGDTYTYRFSGMSGVVRKDQKSQLFVAVTAQNTIDSTDTSSESWMVEVGGTVDGANNYNYISARSPNGRYREFGADLQSSKIDFQSAGSLSSDQRLRVTSSATNAEARVVQVSQTSDTNDIPLLAIDVKAENAAMIVQRFPVTLTVVGGGSDAVAPYTGGIVKSLKLYVNGAKVSEESVPQDGIDSDSETIVFGNYSKLGYKISANDTVKFEVRADLNDVEDTGVSTSDFDDGDVVSASFTSSNLTDSTIELDNYGKDSVLNRTGSVTGENQTLRSTGVQVSMGKVTSEATTNQNGEVVNRIIRIPVALTAFDSTMYLTQSVQQASVITGTNAIALTFEDSIGVTHAITNSATWSSSDATVVGGVYRIDAGSTRNFILTVVLSGVSGQSQSLYRVQLNQINVYTNSALTTGQTIQTLVPYNSYEGPYFTLNLS